MRKFLLYIVCLISFSTAVQAQEEDTIPKRGDFDEGYLFICSGDVLGHDKQKIFNYAAGLF